MEESRALEVLRRIEREAMRGYLPIIGAERGKILVDLVRRVKPKRVLEIGTFIGYSTIMMGKELDEGAEIITIEIDEDEAEEARRNIELAGIKPKIRAIVGNALEVIPKLRGKFDFVFIDAAKKEYLSYLRLMEDKLHKGSVVVADNAGIFAYSMKDYLKHVRNSGKYESRFIRVGSDGIGMSVRSEGLRPYLLGNTKS